MAAAESLSVLLDRRTREGELWEPLEGGKLRCYACGHRCVILAGQRGICKVRYNEGGRLLVPFGYVAGLQLDPVEKKPFFHAYPGSRALSFGMLGCDYHCSYCTAPSTTIATSKGPISIKRLFDSAQTLAGHDAAVRVHTELEVYTHTGRARRVRALFRHQYSGPMVKIWPAYLLPLSLTPDHELLALPAGERNGSVRVPMFIRADQLAVGDYLAIPKQFEFSRPVLFEVAEILRPGARRIRHKRLIGPEFLRKVSRLSAKGLSSRAIGHQLGKSPSHIRHLLSNVRRGVWDLKNLFHKPAEVRTEGGRVRLSKEHAPGIPERIPLNEKLSALLGYYAAEGCVLHDRNRVHSAELVFALGHHEEDLARRICDLISEVFGVKPILSRRQTTLAVVVKKASVAMFFEYLCGTGARRKRVPTELFCAPKAIVEAFLRAYVEGDGHCSGNGQVSVATVSRDLALGVAWLVLKTGRFPSIRHTRRSPQGTILGRTVRQARNVFGLTWFEESSKRRWLREDDGYFYVPIRRVKRYSYEGFVYNLEVEQDHSYLAQFMATHNCQNWLTSQALRDAVAGTPPQDVGPEEVIALARRYRARILTSTYNEPLITSEWAVEVFRAAKPKGFVCSYVSNGNATPEVLEYIRPWVDLYKVDLKGFDDKHYRKLGGVLQVVLDSIRRIWAMGFWLEIVTLVVPGFNDSDEELRDIARFLVSVSPDIPWHVTAFHQDYKMTDRENTQAKTLIHAAEIGVAAGLRYVYAGNIPGRVGPYENTYCPNCRALLIERVGYTILQYALLPGGACPKCQTQIPGRWD